VPRQAEPGGPAASWTAASDLIWTRYSDSADWVVYNPASGDIHLLTDAAHRLWELIHNGVTTADALSAALASELADVAGAELQTATHEALTSMDRVGLIRPLQR
jgi:PqqD family protein of HPr-rel-A system